MGGSLLLLASCATTDQYSSGRLARVSPTDFIGLDPQQIAVGIDVDSRVPIEPSRIPEFLVAVMPVDHDAWEPIGARLRMRPLNLLGDKPDRAGGTALRNWTEAGFGRTRLAYVLTDESRQEMVEVQRRFTELLAKFPPSSGKRGALRMAADARWLVAADQQTTRTQVQTWLQLSVAEGPFLSYDGPIDQMR